MPQQHLRATSKSSLCIETLKQKPNSKLKMCAASFVLGILLTTPTSTASFYLPPLPCFLPCRHHPSHQCYLWPCTQPSQFAGDCLQPTEPAPCQLAAFNLRQPQGAPQVLSEAACRAPVLPIQPFHAGTTASPAAGAERHPSVAGARSQGKTMGTIYRAGSRICWMKRYLQTRRVWITPVS